MALSNLQNIYEEQFEFDIKNLDKYYTFKSDCLNALKKIPNQSIDFILTDPPYNLGLFMKNRQTNLKALRANHFSGTLWDHLEFDQWSENIDQLFNEFSRILKKGKCLIIFMSIIKVETIIRIAEKYGFYYKTTGIWHKKNPMPRNKDLHFINSTETWIYFTYGTKTSTFNNNGKTYHDFFESSATPANEKKNGRHPTQKPLILLNHLISLLSNKNEIVLDPFMGSGSTGIAALNLKRKFIGIELNKTYYDLSNKSLSQYS